MITDMQTISVQSASEPGHSHEVTRRGDGSCSCTCVGYAYRRHCSHIPLAVERWSALDSQRSASVTLHGLARRIDNVADRLSCDDVNAWEAIRQLHTVLNSLEAKV